MASPRVSQWATLGLSISERECIGVDSHFCSSTNITCMQLSDSTFL